MLTKTKELELKIFAEKIRLNALSAINSIGLGHAGGALSIAEILAVLYGEKMNIRPNEPNWRERDFLVLSKGHAGPGLYGALAIKGYFDESHLRTMNKPGSILVSHVDMTKTPGVDMTAGSLGQGGSCAAGIALGNKLDGLDNYTYTIYGDGECQEGQVYEMLMFASQYKLTNLICFVDNNDLQIDGRIAEINDIRDMKVKAEAFGWHAQQVDGHDVQAISEAIDIAKSVADKPSLIVLKTKKGRGWSQSEDKLASHSMSISDDMLEQANGEINARIEALEAELAKEVQKA